MLHSLWVATKTVFREILMPLKVTLEENEAEKSQASCSP